MPATWVTVPTFGGGLNWSTHPAAIKDDEWTYCDGFRANRGTCESLEVFSKISTGSWRPAGYGPIGLVEDMVSKGGWGLITVANSSRNAKLFTMTADGTATEKTLSGTSPKTETTSINPYPPVIMDRTVMNGVQYFPVGFHAGENGFAAYDGVNLLRLTPTADTISGKFLVNYQNRLITASGSDVSWSDEGDGTVWTPAVSNSADTATLETLGDIVSVLPTTDGVLLVGAEGIVMLRATGGVPAFTAQLVSVLDNTTLIGNAVQTSLGVLVARSDGLFQATGGLWEPSWKVWPSLNGVGASFSNGATLMPKMLYLSTVGELMLRTVDISNGNKQWIYRVELATGSWSRVSAPGVITDHAVIRYGTFPLWLMDGNGAVWTQPQSAGVYANATVSTKDFAAPDDGNTVGYIDRIRVSWEPLENDTGDAITVKAWARQDYFPSGSSQLGSKFSTDVDDQNVTYTTVGTLTGGGVTELPCRLRGRYVRFKFTCTSGGVRIRGFSFRWKAASDRKGAAA